MSAATVPPSPPPGPCQFGATVLANRPAGAFWQLTLAAAEVAALARPGQFVALAVGEAPTAMLLRRSFSLHAAGAGTIEIVVADAGPGSGWVTRRRPGDVLDVVGPLGRPFPPPAAGSRCVLVGGGYGGAPLSWWARELVAAGHRVDVVLGAADADRLCGQRAARAGGAAVQVTTDDGSAGTRGRVTAVLPALLGAGPGPVTVYACGPMAMLRAVHELAAEAAVTSWLAVEEAMACGIGVCMTCVLPVRHEDGTRMTRTCVEGPTLRGDTVRWDAISIGPHGTTAAVPPDCLGAPGPVSVPAGAADRGAR